jgi:hypothetical protein
MARFVGLASVDEALARVAGVARGTAYDAPRVRDAATSLARQAIALAEAGLTDQGRRRVLRSVIREKAKGLARVRRGVQRSAARIRRVLRVRRLRKVVSAWRWGRDGKERR